MKLLFRGLSILLALVLLLALGAGWCAWQYNRALAITSPDGIDQSGYVRIGGIDQWIQIRGENKANPILLWLNGGPGYSIMSQTLFYRDWEKYFTIVMWDQRGEGKTLEKSGTAIARTMTIPRMAEDGIAVADYVRKRLGKDRIILLGHSWGSILGVEMARRRPDLFSVYVGTGQVAKLRDDLRTGYPLLLEHARMRGNQTAMTEPRQAGPPPYADPEKYFVLLKWANAFDPPIRRARSAAALWANLNAMLDYFSPGPMLSQRRLLPAMLADDLTAAQLAVPVVIVEGDKDLVTPRSRAFFDTVAAPRKSYSTLAGDGHLAIFSDPSRFLKVLLAQVRPLAH
jgi:pimeloyl-ACP methyl ester carboxylesterase